VGKDLCIDASGGPKIGCQRPRDFSPGEAPVTFEGAGGGDRYYLAGPVTARVSRVSVVLSDGAVLRLEPVRFGLLRWVGVMLPTRVGLAEVIAYSAGREIAHAIPFQGAREAMPRHRGVVAPRPAWPGQDQQAGRIRRERGPRLVGHDARRSLGLLHHRAGIGPRLEPGVLVFCQLRGRRADVIVGSAGSRAAAAVVVHRTGSPT
jgi:hypothetical protein